MGLIAVDIDATARAHNLTPLEHLVLDKLARQPGARGAGGVKLYRRALAGWVRKSERHVARALARLRTAGVITVHRAHRQHLGDGRWRSTGPNRYRVILLAAKRILLGDDYLVRRDMRGTSAPNGAPVTSPARPDLDPPPMPDVGARMPAWVAAGGWRRG